MHKQNRFLSGFTIVELIIVIVVIAILAVIVTVAYRGIEAQAHDKALLSDINNVESELARYATKNSGKYTSALDWDSSAGTHSNISFTPSQGNVIIVRANATDYCIKAYNPASNKKTLETAALKESRPNVCDTIDDIATEPEEPETPEEPTDPYEIPLSETPFTLNEIDHICSSVSNAPSGYNVINSNGAYVTGTAGNDIIYQSSNYGYTYGGNGNDIICIGSLSGYVYGQDGNDIIRVASGAGYAYGGNGNDTLWSTSHIGYLYGDENDDVLYAHQSLGYAYGGNGNDKLNVVGGYTIPRNSIEELF